MLQERLPSSVGRAGFIDEFGVWDVEQRAAAERLEREIADHDLRAIRVMWSDQYGIARGKSVPVAAFPSVLRNGLKTNTGPLFFDTGSAIVFNPFVVGGGFEMDEMTGCPDLVLVPDPATFRVVPWADRTGLVLCDLYFQNGQPVPFCARGALRRAAGRVRERGWGMLAGLEVEWHLARLADSNLAPEHLGAPGAPGSPPSVEAVSRGYSYQSMAHLDEQDDILATLQHALESLGLPLRTMEDEWGPCQLEFTFDPLPALDAADAFFLFRAAAKQVARRHGYHATFMCRPALQGFFSTGWHLHQSLVDAETGRNLFEPVDGEPISPLGRQYVGGILEHAGAASLFTTPTVNGYKRLKPNSLAPDRAVWGSDNRGAMIRLIGGPGDPSTHVENRIGEPAANPYLYIASQIVAGLDGIERNLDPGELSEECYAADRPLLPANLGEAIEAARKSTLYREQFGDHMIDYTIGLKESELGRYTAATAGLTDEEREGGVTEWEQREYFEHF